MTVLMGADVLWLLFCPCSLFSSNILIFFCSLRITGRYSYTIYTLDEDSAERLLEYSFKV